MVDVFVPKGEVGFPAICPMCLKSGPSTKVAVSDKQGHVSCEVAYCKQCADIIGWHHLEWHRPAVQVRELGDKWLAFQFKSAQYAHQFLEFNPMAFEPKWGWRWASMANKVRAPVRKALAHLLRFAVVYFLYLGVVLPFAHAAVAEVVPWIGIPFSLAAVYVWALLIKRTKPK